MNFEKKSHPSSAILFILIEIDNKLASWFRANFKIGNTEGPSCTEDG